MNVPGHVILSESELLARVRQPMPVGLYRRYRELIARRDADALTLGEREELLRLTDEVEQRNVEWLEQLADLARLRGVTLRQLMDDLNIHPSDQDA